MPDFPKFAMVCGVKLGEFAIMSARRPGRCGQTGNPISVGDQILYKRASRLTEDEQFGLFGDRQPCDIVVLWDAVKNLRIVELGQDEAPKPKKKTDFEPSSYQEKIKEALLTTARNILVAALAGCAKTTTIVWLIWLLYRMGFLKGKSVFFLAYNKNIRNEIEPDLKGSGVPALTSHQFCLRHVLGYDIKDKEKNRGDKNRRLFLRVVVDKLERNYDANSEQVAMNSGFWKFRSRCLQMVEKVKNWAICPTYDGTGWVFSDDQRDQIRALMKKYRIEVYNNQEEETLLDLICGVLSYGIPAPGIVPSEYDFDDMLYLVLVLDLPLPVVHLVFVDETQDWNAAQLRILSKLEANGCRIMAVGDQNQAIYAFRGADSRAWDRLRVVLENSRRGMTICDLPINYRSAEVIIEYAQEIVPALQGFKKVRGVRNHDTSYGQMLDMFRDRPSRFIEDEKQERLVSYAVICRTRAPLIHAAYDIIMKGLPVCVLGKGDLTRPLFDIVEKVCGYKNSRNRCNRISDLRDTRTGQIVVQGFLSRLEEYVRVEKAKYEGREEFKEKLSEMTDNAEALKVIATNVRNDTVDSLCDEIEALFVEKPTPGAVTLSTVHGAKGLEWDVVCIICPNLLPHPSVKMYDSEGNITDEYQQEINCVYIARTRPKYEIYVIEEWPYGEEENNNSHPQPGKAEGYDDFWGMEGKQESRITEDLFDVRQEANIVVPNSHQFVNRLDDVEREGNWESEAAQRGVFGPVSRVASDGQRAAARPTKKKFVDDGRPF